jgi:regulator of sigma E protease
LTTLLAFAFVLGVLVFVHELGHFVAAKRVGIKVLKFQLGFNPTIVSVRRGDTEYSIGALPLGGYVKMAGENPDDNRTGRSDEFLSKTKWERFQVLIMGPLMNLILAVALTAVVLYQGAAIPAYQDEPPVVGAVPADTPAERAGIQPGDRILTVAGRNVDTWEDFFLAVGTRPNREIPIGFLRNGVETTRMITPVTEPGTRFEIGFVGVLPDVHPTVPSVAPGEPADQAGIRPGDVILEINGESIIFPVHLREAISRYPGQTITLAILRDGVRQEIQATPGRCVDYRTAAECEQAGLKPESAWLGVTMSEATKLVQPGPIEAIGMSVERNIQFSVLIFETLWGLITGQTSPRQLMGPVAIAQLSGESAQLGWVALFSLMANISLNLGLLNLLPIPVLDGGHIFIMALEGVARRDFSMRVKEKMLLAGFLMLMMLMVTVIYNDLTRISWIERLMPWR